MISIKLYHNMLKIGDLIMAEYPHQTQSPFFKSFTPRMGNVGRMWLDTQRREQQARQAQQQAQQPVPWFGAGNTKPTRGMLGQSLSPQPWQAPPQPPQQVQEEVKEENLPDLSTPEAAAEHIQQINQGLPDGVKYEAMDEETQAALQKIQGMQNTVQATPSAPAPTQVQPQTPEVAANHIRQVNRGLPDGVRYEPIDEETKAALEKIQNMQNTQAATTEESTPTPKAIFPTEDIVPQNTPVANLDLLKRLVQDEQNAFQYYQYLSEIAPSEDLQKKLQEISNSCNNRRNTYQQMLQNDFDAKEIQINDTIQFAQGMAIALREETKILDNMAKLIEQSGNDSNLQNMLNKRLIQQTWLQWALLQTK